MTEQTENLVLEILRAMRGDVQEIKADIRDLKTRVTMIEVRLGDFFALYAQQSQRIDRLENRLERVEQRLDLRDERP